MKVVLNRNYGGFGLSQMALRRLVELGVELKSAEEATEDEVAIYQSPNGDLWEVYFRDRRTDPLLIQVVEELGFGAGDEYARLEIVEIPDDVEFDIQDYDGSEWIAEKHRTWPAQEEGEYRCPS